MSFNVFCLTFYKDHTGTAAVPMISKKIDTRKLTYEL